MSGVLTSLFGRVCVGIFGLAAIISLSLGSGCEDQPTNPADIAASDGVSGLAGRSPSLGDDAQGGAAAGGNDAVDGMPDGLDQVDARGRRQPQPDSWKEDSRDSDSFDGSGEGNNLTDSGGAEFSEDIAQRAEPDVHASSDAGGDTSIGEPSNPSGGCGNSILPGTKSEELQFAGSKRTYLVHVPLGYTGKDPLPVVVVLHGLTQNGLMIMATTGFATLAEQEHFLTVFPDGVANSWNAGGCCGTAQSSKVDDVGFLIAVVDQVEQQYCVDSKRIYATGLSNGSYMTHRLGCEQAHRFAALGTVAGQIALSQCKPSRPMPMIGFHGTSDLIVPYNGGLLKSVWSVDDTVDLWKNNAKCTDVKPTEVYQKGDTTCLAYVQCTGGYSVEFCTSQGAGHQWPSSPVGEVPLLGKMSKDVDATQRIWSFFKKYSL